ncbi:hypothetical protein AVEN_75367-1 [Araneus ventricosus]|uniref:USP domain-containing protein n=1 Tax=Araneus ventricosus TaxID=182803 RepID=A0A4Y2R3W9_ARAVE|nr:hypothetical protein AVEN_75367-1 [Araneus ventricosus]
MEQKRKKMKREGVLSQDNMSNNEILKKLDDFEEDLLKIRSDLQNSISRIDAMTNNIQNFKNQVKKEIDKKMDSNTEDIRKKKAQKEKIEKMPFNECLHRQFNSELREENFCKFCKTVETATKRAEFYHLPKVLILHLNRFVNLMEGREKISSEMHCPQVLELSDESCKKKTFKLHSVIAHFGSYSSGHYKAYVQCVQGLWLEFDDHEVDIFTNIVTLNSTSYVAIYEEVCISEEMKST